MRNNNVKNLTYGASISAIYIVLIIIARAFGQLYVDSPLTVILPIPIALYTYKYGFKFGLIVSFVTSLSTLFVDPTMGLVLVSTATFSGAFFGYLERKLKSTLFKGLLLFVVFVLVDLLVTYVAFKILGYDLIKDTKEMAKSTIVFLNSVLYNYQVNEVLFTNLLVGLIPLVVVLSDAIRTVFTMFFFDLLSLRLKFKTYAVGFEKLYLKLNPIHSILFLIVFFINNYLFSTLLTKSSVFLMVVFNLTLFIAIIYSFLIIIQTNNFLVFKLKIGTKSSRMLFVLLSVFVFPLIIIIGLIINITEFKKNNISKI